MFTLKNKRFLFENEFGLVQLQPTSAKYKKLYPDEHYNMELKIILKWPPLADSRPRFVMGRAVSVNLGKLKKLFKDIYDNCEELKNLISSSHYRLGGKFYLPVTQPQMKIIKSDKHLMKLFEEERLRNLGIKDWDNMIKVHNDLLFCQEYLIFLDDAYCVGSLNTEKTVTTKDRARAELTIIFSTNYPNKWFEENIEKARSLFRAKISYKAFLINKINSKNYFKVLQKYINYELNEIKGLPDARSLLICIAKKLEEYPVEVLSDINNMKFKDIKFKKSQIIYDMLKNLTSSNPFTKKILDGKKGEFWQNESDE